MPAVVTAAVPRRSPLVTNGFSGSFGIAFLLTVMPARSSASWACLPVTPKGRRSTSIRWLSVPPDTIRKPSPSSPPASACALRTIPAAYSRNPGWAASWNATALAAITCMSGPPWRPGNTALSIAAAYSSRHRMQPARGPRRVLCVVSVMTSAYGAGDGCAPPTMRPAMWAASTRNNAPTSSAIWRKAAKSMIRGYAVAPATIIFGRSRTARSRIRS